MRDGFFPILTIFYAPKRYVSVFTFLFLSVWFILLFNIYAFLAIRLLTHNVFVQEN